MPRPRKPVNEAEREQRRNAGLGNRAHVPPTPPTDKDDQEIPADFLDGDDGQIQQRYRAYLKKYGVPRDWTEALTAEKVRREIATSVGAGIAVDEQRGRLVERKQVKASVYALRDILYEALNQVAGKSIGSIPDMPANLKYQLISAVQTHIDSACAGAIAEAIKRHG